MRAARASPSQPHGDAGRALSPLHAAAPRSYPRRVVVGVGRLVDGTGRALEEGLAALQASWNAELPTSSGGQGRGQRAKLEEAVEKLGQARSRRGDGRAGCVDGDV